MENVAVVVNDLLSQLAGAREVPAHAPPAQIVVDSMDQMRFLVGLEERLDVFLDDVEPLTFDLESREALVKSVEAMLAQHKEAL